MSSYVSKLTDEHGTIDAVRETSILFSIDYLDIVCLTIICSQLAQAKLEKCYCVNGSIESIFFLSFCFSDTHLYRLAKINVYTYIHSNHKQIQQISLILYFCIQSDQLTKCLLCSMIYEKKYFFICLSFCFCRHDKSHEFKLFIFHIIKRLVMVQ